MLLLIMAYGNHLRLIEKDVSRHKSGVGEKACVYVVGILAALVLELSHTGELAEHGVAVKYPAKLGVAGNVALNEENVLFGVKSCGDVERKGLVCSAAKLCGVLANGDSVLVNDAVVAAILLGELLEVLEGAEIVTYSKLTGGLNSGKYDFFIFIHCDTSLEKTNSHTIILYLKFPVKTFGRQIITVKPKRLTKAVFGPLQVFWYYSLCAAIVRDLRDLFLQISINPIS